MIIGITGKSGVGKTTFANTFFKNYHIISIDEVSHKVLDYPDIQKQIKDKFDVEVSSTSRTALGDLIFCNRHKMKELSDLIWDKMEEIINDEILSHENVVIDWILLPHTKFFKMCNIKILIEADNDLRKEKVLKRDNISKEYLEKRDNNAISYNKEDFDYIIKNNYNFVKS